MTSEAGVGAAAGPTLSHILKGAAATGFAIEAARNLTGCATMGFGPEENVIYPPLPGKKVQPPEYGCFFGMHYSRDGYHGSDWADSVLESEIGRTPMIVIPPWQAMESARKGGLFSRRMTAEDFMSNEGTIPFINKFIQYYLVGVDFEKVGEDKTFIRDHTEFARGIVKKGRPLFFTTMHEMNVPIWPWSMNRKGFKNTWRRMHDIFDQEGANEYATWVFEPYVTSTWDRVDAGLAYYPGDEYVDWQGISGYSRDIGTSSASMSLGMIINSLYYSYRRKTPEKPVMVVEFGKTKGNSQPAWLEGAFHYFKNHSGIKAACYWDNIWDLQGLSKRDDHTLSKKSLQALDRILEDPYFICGDKGSKLY
jgi:hypothetical protein